MRHCITQSDVFLKCMENSLLADWGGNCGGRDVLATKDWTRGKGSGSPLSGLKRWQDDEEVPQGIHVSIKHVRTRKRLVQNTMERLTNGTSVDPEIHLDVQVKDHSSHDAEHTRPSCLPEHPACVMYLAKGPVKRDPEKSCLSSQNVYLGQRYPQG